MLFQGEEYGEDAPFKFFSDHIDEDIAAATREGRRREFAAFAEFRGREVPDPQDPATFEASKLTRERRLRRGSASCTRRCCACAATCRRATPTRSSSTSTPGGCACSAARTRWSPTSPATTVHVPVDGTVEPVVATAHITLEPGFVVLGALSGALVRLGWAP